MHPHCPPLILGCLLLTTVALGGCKTAENSAAEASTTRTFSYESSMYRVEVDQRERNGECIRRDVLFTAFNRLYTEPHVSRVRAVDVGCNATDVTSFEEFEIRRSPEQVQRYQSSFAFRSRVNEDLWDAYQSALFDAGQQ